MARRLSIPLLAALLCLPGCDISGGDSDRPPQLGAKADESDAAAKLGFPSTATRNTIRVGGGDAAADVAGVAGAVFPATSDASKPKAVVLVDKEDWQGGVAASLLMATPIGAPILLSDGDDLPAVSEDTLERLDPAGSDLSKDAQVIRIGDRPPSPGGRKTAVIEGKNPYEIAAAVDRYFSVAKGEPSKNVIVASGERSEYAMPAAAWAARSGDSVLFTEREKLPDSTAKALERHEKPNIFVLGPEPAVGRSVEKALARFGPVRRVAGPTPVQNAIEFTRYKRGDFGWGVKVPGYNFTLASTGRPLDAAASAALATNGVFAPLLLTDDAKRLPRSVESYFLDVQPGYEKDPSVGVFNRVWVLGDDKTISVAAQGRLDEITALVPVEVNRP